jgi:DNA-directed RNA polymerase subunit K/omega
MVRRPVGISAFEFSVLAGLRAAQLTRGSLPRVGGSHKVTVTAQMEIAELKVARATNVVLIAAEPAE